MSFWGLKKKTKFLKLQQTGKTEVPCCLQWHQQDSKHVAICHRLGTSIWQQDRSLWKRIPALPPYTVYKEYHTEVMFLEMSCVACEIHVGEGGTPMLMDWSLMASVKKFLFWLWRNVGFGLNKDARSRPSPSTCTMYKIATDMKQRKDNQKKLHSVCDCAPDCEEFLQRSRDTSCFDARFP
ncbi:uncharacterized protein LOC111864195 isoform X2 [Cryptotermes secundus]|uniref:uncharacterized protein LOC111864195 isoform X2 n=1 Tax=Cryptotermes secundus TaxID=105785 RepID=UPI000CD7BCC4|nr:uncharacterized protein LOC111864195 isoform X2 [Cryptotermes secundus]